MKNIKDKKTEADLDNLILSLTKNKITESTRKETEFKLGALFVYLLMIKVNTKKEANNIKKKLSKKSICIYMPQVTWGAISQSKSSLICELQWISICCSINY